MSHELRTPLNAIINFTRFVANGDVGPVNEQQEQMLGDVVDRSKHLLNLINDVLDMSKIESGTLNLFVVDNLNLQPILEHVISIGHGLLTEKDVTIVTDIAPDLPAMRGDKQRITQILLNIMSNACKFTEEGKITIKASHDSESLLISISDSGLGIATEDIPAVFESFEQTQAGLRQGGGTGLGMPISKTLVEVHGGRLWVDSEINEGSTFYVSLPIQYEQLQVTLRA